MKIKLKDRKILFKGGNRICYLHPDDDNKILKVLSPEKLPEAKRKTAPLYKKFRTLNSFDDNLKELKAFKNLAQRGEGVWRHFPKCFGMMETDLGDAICLELIRSGDGSLAPTVNEYIRIHGLTGDLMKAMEDFFSFLRNNHIITRDLHGRNLILKKNGGFRIYMIDGIGNSDFIPIANLSKTWAKHKINRNVDKLKNRLQWPGSQGDFIRVKR